MKFKDWKAIRSNRNHKKFVEERRDLMLKIIEKKPHTAGMFAVRDARHPYTRLIKPEKRTGLASKPFRTIKNRKHIHCPYCVRKLVVPSRKHKNVENPKEAVASREHPHPYSKGGRKMVWACRTCNAVKADKTMEEWQEFMKQNPRWWEKKK